MLIFRSESGLIYFNMDHVRDTILDRVRSEVPQPKLVLLDLSASPHMDLHSSQMLGSVADELKSAGIRVQAVEARSSVREGCATREWKPGSGGIDRVTSRADAVAAFQR